MTTTQDCMPPGSVKLRESDADHGSKPFLGGVDPSGRVGFYSQKHRSCFFVPLTDIVRASAEAYGCSYDEMLEFLRERDPHFPAVGQSAPDLTERAHAGDRRSGLDQD